MVLGDFPPPPQPRNARRRAILRLAVVVGLVSMSLALLSGTTGVLPGLRRQAQTDSLPLRADLIYRAGLALQAAESTYNRPLGSAPENLIQSGIAAYERAALSETRNTQATFRLAVIYARRGFPEQGVELLGSLVFLDEANAPLYMAVSGVYDPKTVETAQLREAARVISDHPGWLTRLSLLDLYRRLGDRERVEIIERQIARGDALFAGILGTVAGAYCLLVILGLVVLGVYLWRWLFHLPRPSRPSQSTASWGVFEALEAAAALLCAMTILGSVAGLAAGRLTRTAIPTWAEALLTAGTYLLAFGVALLVMRHRMAAGRRGPLSALGLSRPPLMADARAGVLGYGVFVALAVLAGALGGGLLGDLYLPPAQQSALDMLYHSQGAATYAIYLLLMCVIAPVLEETVFRGFIHSGLRSKLRPLPAIVAGSALFGAYHMTLALPAMAAVALVGALLAVLYERTGSLWPGILTHSLHNLLAFLVVLAVTR